MDQTDPLLAEALSRFEATVDRARDTSLREPLAMTLATADRDGRPAARIVLLRQFDDGGFVFYTNTASVKGRQLAENPQAALCFHWDELREQIRITGPVERVTDQQADSYWAQRPRESQIGAWASHQSATLESRETLEEATSKYERQFAGQEVPRPEFWTGFRVVPHVIEFWQGRAARLHDREIYEKQGDRWAKRLLFP